MTTLPIVADGCASAAFAVAADLAEGAGREDRGRPGLRADLLVVVPEVLATLVSRSSAARRSGSSITALGCLTEFRPMGQKLIVRIRWSGKSPSKSPSTVAPADRSRASRS